MTDERWLPIPGYEGLYDVSDLGQVRSVPRTDARGVPRKGVIRKLSTRNGYYSTRLYKHGESKAYSMHVLVLTAFVGPRPDGMVVRHLNGNPSDNRLDNLSWGTPSTNQLDSVRHGTHHEARKTHCPNGHEYAGKNLRLVAGTRRCRTCVRDAHSRWVQRQKLVGAFAGEADDV
jgi:hypothetical protein